jgi:hypothetical protein
MSRYPSVLLRVTFLRIPRTGKLYLLYLRSEGGKTHADTIHTRPRSKEVTKYEKLKRREEADERIAQLITFLQS